MICAECRYDFSPLLFRDYCDSCGLELKRQYEALQEYRAHNLTMAELVSRVVWGQQQQQPRKAWVVW